jgi:hypothetical protein
VSASTGEFRALEEKVTEMQADLDRFRQDAIRPFTIIAWDRARRDFIEDFTGVPAPKPPRQRHLHPVDGGAS